MTDLPKSIVEPADFGLSGPPPRPSQLRRSFSSAYSGYSGFAKAGGVAQFQSLLELDLQTLLACDPEIAAFKTHAHQLSYCRLDADEALIWGTYQPDVTAQTTSGRVLIFDAKAKVFANSPPWRARAPWIERAYQCDHRAKLLVLDEHEIRRQPRLDNSRLLLSHSRDALSPALRAASEKALQVLASGSRLSELAEALTDVGTPTDHVFAAIAHLIIAGRVMIDFGVPVGRDSAFLVKASGLHAG